MVIGENHYVVKILYSIEFIYAIECAWKEKFHVLYLNFIFHSNKHKI